MSKTITHHSPIMVILVALLLILVVGASACANQKETNNVVPRFKFVVVIDGQVTDPFWSNVQRGITKAATDTNVTVIYRATTTFSVPAMSQLIDTAIATKPDGLVVSIPNCPALTPAIKRAQLVGIPIISIDSGNTCPSSLGLLNHIGQDGYQAGLESGQKLVAAGAKHVLCINQAVGIPDLDDRCRGIYDALKQVKRKSEVLAIDLNNSMAIQQLQAKLAHDNSIDAIMTLSPTAASIATSVLQDAGLSSHIIVATFDLSSPVLQAIQQGTILFAFDQKPYWQGYLPITWLARYKKHLNIGATSASITDPGFVTIENVLQVEQSLKSSGTS